MKQKIVVIILCIGCLVSGGLVAFNYLNRDRKGPVINTNEDITTYVEGTEADVLLEGVTAYDEVDGDVSDTLSVESVKILSDGRVAITYVASDKSNNVTKLEKMLTLVDSDGKQVVKKEEKDNEEDSDNGSSNNNVDSNDDEGNIYNDDTSPLEPDGESPVIRLNMYRVTLSVGDTFNPMRYVFDAVDDEDDASTRIQVDPLPDMDTAGTYDVRFYVVDSDGNTSNIEVLEVIVE